MPFNEERNILRMGPPSHPGETEITPAMVEAVRQHIKDAGGNLVIWAVLDKDLWNAPPYGDDDRMALRAIALNSVDAGRLIALDQAPSQFAKWIIKGYRLGLRDGVPAITNPYAFLEGFTINDVVEILCEIPPGGIASKMHMGTGHRRDGPLLSLP